MRDTRLRTSAAYAQALLGCLLEDLRYATRGLLRDRVFSSAVIVTLALGIGATAAVFSLADRLFLRQPNGVTAPRQLRRLYLWSARTGTPVPEITTELRYVQALAIERSLVGHARSALYVPADTVPLIDPSGSRLVEGAYADGDYFPLLGVHPALGRLFSVEEARPGTGANPLVAVLAYGFWERHFGGDSSVIGQPLDVAHQRYIIIGIAPPGFAGVDLGATDMWMTLASYPSPPVGAGAWYAVWNGWARVHALIRPDSSTSDAWLSAAATASNRNDELAHQRSPDSTAKLIAGPLAEALGPSVTPTPDVAITERLVGISLIVLLVACANVANLLLLRAGRRSREITIRVALGISRARLARQFITESVVLSIVAGVAAVAMAVWATAVLRAALLPSIHWPGGVLDWRLLAFGIGLAMVAGVAAGAVPALHASRPDLTAGLKSGEREGGSGRRGMRVRGALTIVQVALSLVLLVGAGLFVRSLRAVQAIDLGYDVNDIVYGSVEWVNPNGHFITFFDGLNTHRAALTTGLPVAAARMSHDPDVEGVALSFSAPMEGYVFEDLFLGDGQSASTRSQFGQRSLSVSPNFFAVTGLPIERGRGFTDADRDGAASVVVINETGARAYWLHGDPLGQCIRFNSAASPCSTVVGVVKDAHLMALIEAPHVIVYTPLAQQFKRPAWVIARARPGRADAVAARMRVVLRAVFPDAESAWVLTRDAKIEPQYRPWQIGASLFGVLGLLALIVAGVGTYSVVAYSVSQRLHEMGVRAALGAQVRDIVSLVVGGGVRLVALGVILGVAMALAMGHLVASLLYGVSPRDPDVMVVVALTLVVTGVVASVVPAWRAARVDPVTALRSE